MADSFFVSLDGCATDDGPRVTRLYTLFEACRDSNFYFGGEIHDFWELVQVVDGNAGITAGDQVLNMSAGDVVLHPPLEFHRIWSEGGTPLRTRIISFAAENLDIGNNRVYRLPQEGMDHLKTVFDALRDAFVVEKDQVRRELPGYQQQACCAVKQLEVFLMTSIHPALAANSLNSSASAGQYAQIVETIHTHLQEKLNVGAIASLCHMSVPNLKKIFRRYAGVGVMQYVNARKMQAATIQLKAGVSVCEAALSVGFEDSNYFCTVFKRFTGQTPLDCKRGKPPQALSIKRYDKR